jgi:hypothetical protein
MDDTAAKGETAFTTGSNTEPVVKPVITFGYLARMGSYRYEPAVIRITASYLKTTGEGPGGE